MANRSYLTNDGKEYCKRYQLTQDHALSGSNRIIVQGIKKRSSAVRSTTQPQKSQQNYHYASVNTNIDTQQQRGLSFFFVIFLMTATIFLVLFYFTQNVIIPAVTQIYNDKFYGTPKTTQVDAIVGHNNDSTDFPSHFIVVNQDGIPVVIELPAGNALKAIIYDGDTVDTYDKNKVFTVVFLDDGKEMVVTSTDGTFKWILVNDGTKFVTQNQKVKK